MGVVSTPHPLRGLSAAARVTFAAMNTRAAYDFFLSFQRAVLGKRATAQPDPLKPALPFLA